MVKETRGYVLYDDASQPSLVNEKKLKELFRKAINLVFVAESNTNEQTESSNITEISSQSELSTNNDQAVPANNQSPKPSTSGTSNLQIPKPPTSGMSSSTCKDKQTAKAQSLPRQVHITIF